MSANVGGSTGNMPMDFDLSAPQPAYLPPTTPRVTAGVARYAGLTYAATPGYRPRLLDLVVPAGSGSVPLVVWVHGGAWLFGDRRYPPPGFSPELLFGSSVRAGMAVAAIDYRHSLEVPFPAQLHDLKAAIRYLRRFAVELSLDPSRVGVWGDSAGGHLAALAGLTGSADPDLEGEEGVADGSSEVQAVVDWYGVSDVEALLDWQPPPGFPQMASYPNPFTALIGGTPAEWPVLARRASPMTYAGRSSVAFLLVHGLDDSLIPCTQSELLAKHLQADGVDVELTLIPHADHVFLGAPDLAAIVAESVAFLARRLNAVPPTATQDEPGLQPLFTLE